MAYGLKAYSCHPFRAKDSSKIDVCLSMYIDISIGPLRRPGVSAILTGGQGGAECKTFAKNQEKEGKIRTN